MYTLQEPIDLTALEEEMLADAMKRSLCEDTKTYNYWMMLYLLFTIFPWQGTYLLEGHDTFFTNEMWF